MREIAGISSRRLSDLADVAEALAAQIERGFTQNPRTETVAKLAAVLGVSLDWLIAGVGQPPDAETIQEAVQKAEAAYRSKVAQDPQASAAAAEA